MVKVKRPGPVNRLRVLRAEHRIIQHDLAAHLGISQTRYWQIENRYTEPTDTEKAKLAKLFKLSATDIFPASSEAVAS